MMLGTAARQQWRLTRQLRRQQPFAEPRIMALLESCKNLLGVERPVTVLAAETFSTPALFGSLRPRLLIPEEMLLHLDDRELRLIFLHELTHLRRGDILVNWAMIFLRSLHWFNPAVWLAMKRLRAEQELACDAAVMARLAPDERRLYGDTLIKLLEDFSASTFCPGLVPFITNKQIIKRRIAMISKFQPASRFALLVSVALLIAVGCFTFTRAADKTQYPPNNSTVQPVPTSNNNESGSMLENSAARLPNIVTAEKARTIESKERSVAVLRNALDKISGEVSAQQYELTAIRKHLAIPNDIAEGKAVSNSENINQLESLRNEAETEYVKKTMLEILTKLNRDELRQALPTAAPDTLLASLLEHRDQTQTKLDNLRGDFGEQYPDAKEYQRALLENLNIRIDDRMQGILKGIEVQVASLKAVVDNSNLRFDQLTKDDNESLDKYQPYFQKKRDLENLQKSRDELMTRIRQEKLELDLLRNAPEP